MNTFNELKNNVLPLMEAYQSDLEHDRALIEAFPSCEFIHATRSTGTNIFILHKADSITWPAAGVKIPYLFGMADRRHILTDGGNMLRHMVEEGRHTWHHYNGKNIKRIPGEAALFFWNDYQAGILDTWHNVSGKSISQFMNAAYA
jgi:hypothetical protein